MGSDLRRVVGDEGPAGDGAQAQNNSDCIVALRRKGAGWSSEDFVDPDALSDPLDESDPWAAASVPNVDFDSHQREETVAGIEVADDDGQAHLDFLTDSDPTTSLAGEAQWSDDIASGITDEWDEPDPTIDPDSGLAEQLYPPDNSVDDVSLELKIHDLLLLVTPIDDDQRARCTALLRQFGAVELRYMLPWLRTRTWCGRMLTLFLEFREIWYQKTRSHWWESWYWDARNTDWRPTYHRSSLTFDVACELVRERSHCQPEEVIDDAWFEDWDNYNVWELGVRSFASFALFRAGLAAEENWLRMLIRIDRRSRAECAECMDDTFAPFMLPSFADQYGLPYERYSHGRIRLDSEGRLRYEGETNEGQPNSLAEHLF